MRIREQMEKGPKKSVLVCVSESLHTRNRGYIKTQVSRQSLIHTSARHVLLGRTLAPQDAYRKDVAGQPRGHDGHSEDVAQAGDRGLRYR